MNENAENTCAAAASREAIEKVCRFLKDTGTYYLATADGEQPRVRPFGTIHIFDGKLYIQTGRAKDVSKQLSSGVSIDEVVLSKNSMYTEKLVLDAVKTVLDEQKL